MIEVKRIVNDIFGSNTYLLFDNRFNYCWLVDIGDFIKVADVIPHGVKVKGLLLTHTHFDHIYGINDLSRAYPDCLIYTAEYGKEALYDDKKNFSKYHEASYIYDGNGVNVLQDGDEIELYPDVFMTVYETPGHCPSCLTYLVDNFLFTGDSYIPGVNVVTKLPKGDRFLAKKSTEKILKLAEYKIIYPGHGETMYYRK